MAVLRTVAEQGPITTSELNQALAGHHLKPKAGCAVAVSNLRAARSIVTTEVPDDGGPTTYSITFAGQQRLNAVDGPPPDAAPPRRPLGGSYDGRDLRGGCARAGAMTAFELPSLRNGEPTPRVRPFILGANRLERASR